MKKPTVIGLAFALLMAAAMLGPGLTAAQGPPAQSGQKPAMGCSDRFDALDANHDGVVTKDEFMAAPHRRQDADQMFKTRDLSGDGTLTRDEFCSGRGAGMGKGRGPMPQ
jgi:hypothetical protein